MVDPSVIPEYPSFRDDLGGRPLRYRMHKEMSHLSAAAWPEWSTWQEILARCYAQGHQTDAAIGDVLGTLDELSLTDNTIVIWLADHGDAVASHGGLWDKSSSFMEEVVRVPMAIRWPAVLPAGRRTDQFVSNMDATATMLDAAGITPPDYMHSSSVLPLCQEEGEAEWADELICEHNGHGHHFPQRMILHDRYKYVFSLHDMNELYDLQEDPFEMKNLVHVAAICGHRSQYAAAPGPAFCGFKHARSKIEATFPAGLGERPLVGVQAFHGLTFHLFAAQGLIGVDAGNPQPAWSLW